MAARSLLKTVWLVGSGTEPDVLTDQHDCHAYLIHDGYGGLLIDCGTGLGAAAWLSRVSETCDPRSVAGVLITHYHADHAGGAADAREAGFSIWASEITADALKRGDEDRTSLARARAIGIYPPDYALQPTPVDGFLANGARVRFGRSALVALDAPGHCDGHMVFLARCAEGNVLFSGDCVFSDGRVGIQALPDCRLDRYAETLIDLDARDVDVLLPGHGPFVLSDAKAGIRRAADTFRRLVPPPNLLS